MTTLGLIVLAILALGGGIFYGVMASMGLHMAYTGGSHTKVDDGFQGDWVMLTIVAIPLLIPQFVLLVMGLSNDSIPTAILGGAAAYHPINQIRSYMKALS